MAPALLFAKPGPSPEAAALDKAVDAAGGMAKYQRLETLTCDFEDTVYGSSEPVTVQGRRAFRLHDGAGLRAWEQTETMGGRVVTVALSTGGWTTLDGKPVMGGNGERLLAEAFWLAAPQRVKESGRPLRLLSSGYMGVRLMDRLAVDGAPLFPGGEGLTLFLNRESGRVEGAGLGNGDLLSFHSFEPTKSLLEIPASLVYYRNGRKTRMVKLSNILVNGYVDEALFQQTSPQGAHP
jgi:hypothetical protein